MYPIDRRKLAVHIYSIVGSLRKTASLLMVSHSTIHRWLACPQRKKYQRSKLENIKSYQIVDIIKTVISCDPFTSIRKLQNTILSNLKLKVSIELVRTVIKKQGFSKKVARHYGQPKNLEEITRTFLDKRTQYIKENKHFVSIDETSFGRNGVNTKGYSEVGKKLFIKKTNQRMTTTSSICCVAKNSIKHKEYEGSINTFRFLEFLKSLELPQDTVVLLDNVKFHHSKVVKQYCQDRNIILLYVPPYSPWFNPIELCFSIVKRKYYEHIDILKSYKALNYQHIESFFRKSLNCVSKF